MRVRYIFLLLCWALTSAPALADDWPSRPIQIVVLFGAGGAADIITRLIGDKLATALGQPVVIEDKPGAGGNIGAAASGEGKPRRLHAPHERQPDTFRRSYLYKDLSYDPMRDVPPVAMLAVAPNLLVVNSSLPVKTVADLVALRETSRTR